MLASSFLFSVSDLVLFVYTWHVKYYIDILDVDAFFCPHNMRKLILGEDDVSFTEFRPGKGYVHEAKCRISVQRRISEAPHWFGRFYNEQVLGLCLAKRDRNEGKVVRIHRDVL